MFLEHLTPSSTLRDSRVRNPSHISAALTNLFFSAGPRLLSSSTLRSSQSSTSSSSGSFVAIPLATVHSSADCARNGPTVDSAVVFGFSVGKSSRASS